MKQKISEIRVSDLAVRKAELHGALLDAEILADVYLFMTGGQTDLALARNASYGMDGMAIDTEVRRIAPGAAMTVLKATDAELSAHQALLEKIKHRRTNIPSG